MSEQAEKEFLKNYDAEKYPKPSVATDIVLFTMTEEPLGTDRHPPLRELKLLLVQRGEHPFKGQWALPGGFLKPDETVGQCARRELREETGLEDIYLEQLFTFSDPHRDPRTWVLSCAHMALADGVSQPLTAGDDAADAAWFNIIFDSQNLILRLKCGDTELTAELEIRENSNERFFVKQCEGIAFDHAKIITYALERLRNKLEYTDLAFHLLPDTFTLPQLQHVHELILGRPLFPTNFRKDVQNKIEPTGEKDGRYSFRPSLLYRRKR